MMQRYGTVTAKNPREIVLLRGAPCVWGKCAFCDYIADNCASPEACFEENRKALSSVTGKYGALEVINSASVFELDERTRALIREIAKEKGISTLYFECWYGYRSRLREMRDYFSPLHVRFKCGIETFDARFRNNVLNKGAYFDSPEEVAQYFDSVCILVGVAGQTREQIARDVEILTTHFPYGCVNVYCNNSSPVKRDEALVNWFRETYGTLDAYPNIDVLYETTDFGVGGSKA